MLSCKVVRYMHYIHSLAVVLNIAMLSHYSRLLSMDKMTEVLYKLACQDIYRKSNLMLEIRTNKLTQVVKTYIQNLSL